MRRWLAAAAGVLALSLSARAQGAQEETFTLPEGATMAMVWIAPGAFTMGSAETEPGRDAEEGPQHQVVIGRGFYLGKYEVTQDQWERVMGSAPWAGWDYVQADPGNPAVFISWDDVQTLVQKLNQAAGDSLYRLPTEAEWEYACRAGTQTRWSFGEAEDELGAYAWYRGNSWDIGEEYGHAVGTKRPNPWGLYDMHGNVWEWCQDWWGAYSGEAQTDPTGPASGMARVARGGNFHNYARVTRSALRAYGPPDARQFYLGARLVRTGPPPTAIAPRTWGEVKDQAK